MLDTRHDKDTCAGFPIGRSQHSEYANKSNTPTGDTAVPRRSGWSLGEDALGIGDESQESGDTF